MFQVHDKVFRYSKLIGVEKKLIELQGKLKNACSLGIIKMSGIGKLTLAKAFNSHIFYKFDATCFIDDLKDRKYRLIFKNKLENLHKQSQVCSLQEEQDILKHARKIKKILIVLDDIKSISQLDELLVLIYLKIMMVVN